MKLDGPLYAGLADAAGAVQRLQRLGHDGLYTLEGAQDPFLPLVLAAEHAPTLDLATGLAVALPRNPAHIAAKAWELQRYSGGRFMLGIGSQVRAHIEGRFGVDFHPVAPRMKEYIQAVRAFFDCWQHQRPLQFEGRFYRHTLMTPMFDPGPNEAPPPPILLGAVGPRMTRVAGEVADGLILHPFNNQAFVREQQVPRVLAALEESGRSRADFILQAGAMCSTGGTEEELAAAREAVRGLVAFYASTPAYLPVLAAVGAEALQPELHTLSRQGRWQDMAARVNDGLLDQFAPSGEPDAVAEELWRRHGDVADRLALYAPYTCSDEAWRSLLAGLRRRAGR